MKLNSLHSEELFKRFKVVNRSKKKKKKKSRHIQLFYDVNFLRKLFFYFQFIQLFISISNCPSKKFLCSLFVGFSDSLIYSLFIICFCFAFLSSINFSKIILHFSDIWELFRASHKIFLLPKSYLCWIRD